MLSDLSPARALDLGYILGTEPIVLGLDFVNSVHLIATESGVHQQFGLVGNHLELVGIAGQDDRSGPGIGRVAADGADQVVGFVAVQFIDRDF